MSDFWFTIEDRNLKGYTKREDGEPKGMMNLVNCDMAKLVPKRVAVEIHIVNKKMGTTHRLHIRSIVRWKNRRPR